MLLKAGACTAALIILHSTCVSSIDEAVRMRLQRAVDSVQKAEKIQGVTAAVILDRDLWQGAAGESYGGRPMTPEMVLGIGSNTKTCTAITLLRLQEKGLIDLDTPIGKWFPQHPNISGAITVRQLLNHTSGLGDYSLKPYRDSTLADLSRLWKPLELLSFIPEKQFDAGTSWNYCNTNYLLAGIIAQEVTGLSLYQLYRRELFNPLGLDTVRLYPDENILGELAHRWMGGRDAFNSPMNGEWSGAWAAGALVATAAEMAQFYEALFSGTVLNAASMTQLTAFVGVNNYGLGISQKLVTGVPVIGHTGEIRGYSSAIFRVPSLRANVVVLTNSIPSNPLAVAAAILRVLRDGTTAVQDETANDLLVDFPAKVYDIEGRFVRDVNALDEVQTLQCGAYMLTSNTRLIVVHVGEDRRVAVSK
jgi:D-alanyl-D-alanine carboxypeptidase